jgi:hypothetical protein
MQGRGMQRIGEGAVGKHETLCAIVESLLEQRSKIEEDQLAIMM